VTLEDGRVLDAAIERDNHLPVSASRPEAANDRERRKNLLFRKVRALLGEGIVTAGQVSGRRGGKTQIKAK